MLVLLANLDLPAHQQATVSLLDMYCRDEFGSGKPLPDDTKNRLIDGLLQVKGICFLAEERETPDKCEFIGLALCLPSFSSFRAQPIINIHDIAVAPGHRGKGVGQALLQAVEDEARRRGCCKVTLEVREDNETAKTVYQRAGFRSTTPETLFWARELGLAAESL
ncbi:MAG: GNAT family N-acetyltransferase [Planctomycetales bacterium]|nr:GNAT family N-acetyltransferase [Planctomycetales bacterium]